MKSFNKTVLLAAFIFSPLIQADSDKQVVTTNLKIEYVDSFAAIRGVEEGQEFAKELEVKRIELGQDLKLLEETLTASAKEFQTKASTMSETGRAREQKTLVKLEREYKAKLQESEEDMKITMQMGQERLLREHNDAVFKYAKANDVDLIFGPGGVVFASEKANCTLNIIEGMNKSYEIKLAKAGNAKNKKTAVASNNKGKKKASA